MSNDNKEQPKMTAGLDLGEKYSYLCVIDNDSGEVIEEGRLRTTPEAFEARFSGRDPMRIAIEAATRRDPLACSKKSALRRSWWPKSPQEEAHLRLQAQDR